MEIPKICQDNQADYEGELVIIMGKDAKNVSKEEALEYVLGYTAGNDVSSRYKTLITYLTGGNGREILAWQVEFLNGVSPKGWLPLPFDTDKRAGSIHSHPWVQPLFPPRFPSPAND